MSIKNTIGKIDWMLLLLYLILLVVGLISIYAAAFNENHTDIYDLTQNYGKQLLFIGISLFTGFVILLIDAKFFNTFAYLFYGLSIFLLLFVLVSGTTIAGSKSWIQLGIFSFQPSELAKFTTALAVAHYLGKNDTDFSKIKTKLIAFGLVLLPMSLVLLQGDAGSALVFLVFLLVFYREGMTGLILVIGLVAIILFLLTIFFSKWYVIIGVSVITIAVSFIIGNLKKNILKIIGVYSLIVIFVLGVNFAFNNILKPHQRNRINVILGIEKDTKNVGYNLNQSLTAIGSGGLTGKGFLQGTMTRYKYVPEQHTDFIFCTIGEENENINPSQLPSSEKNSPSENLLKVSEKMEGTKKEEKPSIREKLDTIKKQSEEQEKQKANEEIKETPKKEKLNETKHKQPKKKNRKKERSK